MKKEHEKSTKIKNDENILAIIGNPPYFNGKSQSISPIIDGLLDDYKKGLNEKKINLNDLYIKFIKFAQHKIDHFNKDKLGVVGIITNNSFLDGITHRKMRQSLLESFDEIYVLNLHGNARKGESDKNIFDIMVGVSICFFVKLAKPQKTKEVFYFSSLENGLISRAQKLEFLANKTLSEISWTKLQPQKSKNFWFIKKE
jgi:predicted helicase